MFFLNNINENKVREKSTTISDVANALYAYSIFLAYKNENNEELIEFFDSSEIALVAPNEDILIFNIHWLISKSKLISEEVCFAINLIINGFEYGIQNSIQRGIFILYQYLFDQNFSIGSHSIN